jgi:RNase P/RNase MRP subunit POP5
LGYARLQQGKNAEAEKTLREALAAYEKNNPDAWQRYNCESLLGASLAGQRRLAEAEPMLVDGYQGLVQRQAGIARQNRHYLDEARNALVRLYTDWGKPDKAAEAQARFAADTGAHPR